MDISGERKMNSYRNNNNIKVGLFFVGLILIIGLLGYSNAIVNRLRNDNRDIVKLYSEIIAKTVNEDSDTNLNFVFEVFRRRRTAVR